MYLDSQLLYSDAQALTATAASTNLIDHDSDRDIGIGEPMCVVLTVGVAAGGTTPTLSFALQTDSSSGFGSAVSVVSSQTYNQAALAQGARYVLPIPPDSTFNRYSRVNYTVGGTSPTVTVTASLIPQRLLQAEQVGASGYAVQ